MKTKIFTLFWGIILNSLSNAQVNNISWFYSQPQSYLQSLVTTIDNNLMTLNYRNNETSLLKLNNITGEIYSINSLNGNLFDDIVLLQKNSDQGYNYLGVNYNNHDYDIESLTLVNLSPEAHELDSHAINIPNGYELLNLEYHQNKTGYIFTFYNESIEEFKIAYINLQGQTIWSYDLDAWYEDIFSFALKDENLLLALNYNQNLNIVKRNPQNGNTIWIFNDLPTMNEGYTNIIKQDSDNNIIVSFFEFDQEYDQYSVIFKLDANGNELWRTSTPKKIVDDLLFESNNDLIILSGNEIRRINTTTGETIYNEDLLTFNGESSWTESNSLIKTNDDGYAFIRRIELSNIDQEITQVVKTNATLEIIENSKSTVNIYPNPVKSILYFTEELKNIKIYSFTGKIVLDQKKSINKLNLPNLESGSYIIEGTTRSNEFFSKKFIKK